MDDVMQPEDDFDTWMAVFLSSIEQKGQYLLLIPGYIKLVHFIINNNELPEPLNEYTTDFLMDFVPNSLNTILSLGYIYANDHEQIQQYLQATSELLSWAMINNRSELIELYTPVFNNQLNYYQSNRKWNYSIREYQCVHWETVVYHFIQKCIPKFVEKILSDYQLTKQYLLFYSSIYSTVDNLISSGSTKVINFDLISSTVPSFLRFLHDINIRDFESSTIQTMVTHFTKLAENYFPQFANELLKFAEDCIIHADYLDKKFVGADILSGLSTSTNPIVKVAFNEWLNTTKLGEYIIGKDVHNKLLEKMQSIISKLMKADLLVKFLSNAFNSHSSQKAIMFSIIVNSISQLDKETSKEFVKSVLTLLKDNKNGSVDDNHLKFLTELAIKLVDKDEELSKFLMNEIVQMIRMPEYRALGCSESILKDLSLNINFQEPLLDMCLSFNNTTDQDQQSFFLKILKILIKSIKNPPYKKIKHSLLNIIQGTTEPIVELKDSTVESKAEQQEVKSEQINSNTESSVEQKNSNVDLNVEQREVKTEQINSNTESSVEQKDLKEQKDSEEKIEKVEYKYHEFIEFDYVRSDVLDALRILINTCNKTLSAKSVEILAKSGIDNLLFHFFYALQNARGSLSFKPKATPIFVDIINCMNLYTASDQFTEFLTNFVFIQNLISGSIKSTVYVPPTSAKMIPQEFTIEKYPLVCFDLLFKACILNQSKQIFDQIKFTIIRIINSANIPDYQKMTNFLVDIISPYIKGSKQFFSETDNEGFVFKNLYHCVNAIYRCFSILIEWIKKVENGFSPEECGFSRHNPKSLFNEDSLPYLPVTFRNETRYIHIPLIVSTDVLSYRLSNLLHISKEKLSIGFDESTYIMKKSTLLDAGMHTKSQIKVSSQYESDKFFKPLVLPSMTLSNLKYQDILLDLLSKSEKLSHNREVNGICRSLSTAIMELLDILPDSNSIDTTALAKIKSIDSQLSFRYCFEIYLDRCDKIDDLSYFLEIISKNDIILIKSIFQFFQKNFDPEVFKPHLKEIVQLSISYIYIPNAMNLLYKLISNESLTQQVTECMYFDIDNLEKSICKFVHETNGPEFKDICKLLTDQRPLFQLCLKHMKDVSICNEIFAETVGKVANSVDLKPAFDKFADSLEFASRDEKNFTNICQALLSIIVADPKLIDVEAHRVKDIFNYALTTDNEHIQDASLRIVKKFFGIESVRKEIMEAVQPILNMEFDFYSYNPSTHTRSNTNKTGLRNLGSTCYMNSILQQLFYVPDFIELILKERVNQTDQTDIADVAAFNSIQRLFSGMLLTKKKSVDTSEFCSTWKWGKNLINPREQQDAFEFFQTFLDQLPSRFHHFFKGTMKNTIEGENFITKNTELFYTFPIEIQHNTNIYDSFKVFLQKELFEGYKTDDGRIIDAYKSSKIQEAPQILVFQLKRFEYDFQTFHRIKINDRFEFPDILDIKEIMDESASANSKYQLNGVVLHCGTAQGGHYTSLKKLQNTWYWFNDNDVSILNGSDFQNETFGYNSKEEYKNSAYLLFYERIPPENSSTKTMEDINANLIDQSIRTMIETENVKYVSTQFAFSKTFFYLLIDLDNYMETLKYFINIYMHSSLKYEGKLESIFTKQVTADSFEFINQNLSKIDNILLYCTNSDILDLLVNVIQLILSQKECSKVTNDFIDHFVKLLPSFISSWRQIASVSQIIDNYLTIGIKQIQSGQSQEYDWTPKLVKFVLIIYENQKSSIILENINLSYVFSSIFLLSHYDLPNEEIVALIPESIKILVNFSTQIMQSEANSKSFLDLIVYLMKLNIVDYIPVLSSLISNSSETNLFVEIFLSAMKAIGTPEQAQALFNVILSAKSTSKIRLYEISQKISSYMHDVNRPKEDQEIVRAFFMKYPNETLIPIIIHPEYQKRLEGITLIKALFPKDLHYTADSDNRLDTKKLNELYNNGLNYLPDDEQKQTIISNMKILYQAFILKFKSIMPNIHSYYHMPSLSPYDKQRRFTESIKIISFLSLCLQRHLVIQINDDPESTFETDDSFYENIRDDFYVFKEFLDKCISEKMEGDLNVHQLCDIFVTFGPKAIEQVYPKIFISFFTTSKSHSYYLPKFWSMFQFCDHFLDNFILLINDFKGTKYETGRQIFRDILISLSTSHYNERILDQICQVLLNILNEKPKGYNVALEFSIHLFDSQNEDDILVLNSINTHSLFLLIMNKLPGDSVLYIMNQIQDTITSLKETTYRSLVDFYNNLLALFNAVCKYILKILVMKPKSPNELHYQTFSAQLNRNQIVNCMINSINFPAAITWLDYFIYSFLYQIDSRTSGQTINADMIHIFDQIIKSKKKQSWTALVALVIHTIKYQRNMQPIFNPESYWQLMNNILNAYRSVNPSAVKFFFQFYTTSILNRPRKCNQDPKSKIRLPNFDTQNGKQKDKNSFVLTCFGESNYELLSKIFLEFPNFMAINSFIPETIESPSMYHFYSIGFENWKPQELLEQYQLLTADVDQCIKDWMHAGQNKQKKIALSLEAKISFGAEKIVFLLSRLRNEFNDYQYLISFLPQIPYSILLKTYRENIVKLYEPIQKIFYDVQKGKEIAIVRPKPQHRNRATEGRPNLEENKPRRFSDDQWEHLNIPALVVTDEEAYYSDDDNESHEMIVTSFLEAKSSAIRYKAE